MKKHIASSLHTRTRLQAGNVASNQCYADRNAVSTFCSLIGWPQTDNIKETSNCKGNRNEINLMRCLYWSGEKNWWKDFPGCTDEWQCLNLAIKKNKDLTGEDY